MFLLEIIGILFLLSGGGCLAICLNGDDGDESIEITLGDQPPLEISRRTLKVIGVILAVIGIGMVLLG